MICFLFVLNVLYFFSPSFGVTKYFYYFIPLSFVGIISYLLCNLNMHTWLIKIYLKLLLLPVPEQMITVIQFFIMYPLLLFMPLLETLQDVFIVIVLKNKYISWNLSFLVLFIASCILPFLLSAKILLYYAS